MCFSVRRLPAVLLTLLSLAPSLCAQSTTKQAAKVPRGSISGRVTIKENGVGGVAIGLRKVSDAMMMSQDPFVKATTDQDGLYRFFGLPSGRYKVSAGRTDDNAFNFNTPERPNYQQVFHPDATDQAKATVIEVSEGSEANDVDIALGPSGTGQSRRRVAFLCH